MKKFLMIIAAALLFPAMLFAKGDVVAYLPSYRAIPTSEQLDKLTHLVLMAIVPGERIQEGDNVYYVGNSVNLPTGGNWPQNLNKVIADAHSNGVDVIIALGGASGTGSFPESVKPANRAEFVENIMAVVNQHGFDGVDIDWEYPGYNSWDRNPQLSNAQLAQEKQDFAEFMVLLKNALGDKRLSFAIGADFAPNFYPKSALDAMDALHIMTYDMAWANDGTEIGHHADMQETKDIVNDYRESGMIAPEKIFYGVPFYGRNKMKWSDAVHYNVIIKDDEANLSQTNFDGTYYYDGVLQIKEKTAFAYEKEIGGIMIWELGSDVAATSDYSLLKAIDDEVTRLGGREGRKINVFVNHNGNGTVKVNDIAVNSGSSFEITESGSNVTVSVNANSGYEIGKVELGGNAVELTDGSFTIENVTSSKSVKVVFAKRHGVPGNINVAEYSFLSSLGQEKVEADGNLGWLENGSSVEYLLNVEEAGEYLISMETAEGNGNDIAITVNDEELITVSGGSNWTDYAKKTAKITLPAGNMTLKIGVNGAVNIKNISITEDDGTAILSGNKMKYAKTFGAAIINGKINLSVPAAAKNASFMLFDVRGRMLMQQQISINSGFASIALPKNIAKNQAAILQVKTNSGFNLTKRVLLK